MNKLKTMQQCAIEANDIPGIRWKSVILPFYQTLMRPSLEGWVLFWAPQCKDNMDILERVQQRATMMKGWKCLLHEERLKKLSVLRLEKKRLRGCH